MKKELEEIRDKILSYDSVVPIAFFGTEDNTATTPKSDLKKKF